MKFYQKYLYLILVKSLVLSYTQAKAGFITAEVDKTIGTISDQFTYTITISGNAKSKPQIPEVDGLVITPIGTSTNTYLINGKFSQEIKYTYIITPERDGTFTIPSITINIDGKDESTAPIKITVKPDDSLSAPHQQNEKDIFIERTYSKSQVYVGEPILIITKIYHKKPIAQAQVNYTPPANVKNFSDKNEYKYTQFVNGLKYNIIEFREILIPIMIGDLTIPAFKLSAQILDNNARRQSPRSLFDDFFDDFFNKDQTFVTKNVFAKPIKIKVQALPTHNKPKDFSGLVGNYKLHTTIDKNHVKIGENINLTIQIDGEGDLQGFENIKFNLSPDIKVYSDKPIYEYIIDKEKGMLSKKVFKFALIPTKAGKYDLGDVLCNFFSPEIGSYINLTENLGYIVVDDNSTDNSSQTSSIDSTAKSQLNKQNVTMLHDDILGIHRGSELLKHQALTKKDFRFFILLWIGIGVLIGLYHFIKFNFKESFIRKKSKTQSLKKFKSTIIKIKQNYSGLEAVDKITNAFKSYLGDTLDVYGPALTSKEFHQKIIEKTSNTELAKEVETQLEKLMTYSYGNINIDNNVLDDIIQSLIKLAKKVRDHIYG